MKISNRLKSICNLITNTNVVDVGCDHALLDIYLTFNGKKCIASDISENVLKQAKSNIKKYNLEDKIEIIQSDGTKNINIPECSTVVIAGMGAHTIIDILNNTNHINIDELIIQSNNDLYFLRKEIVKLGYLIDKEISILDKDKYYVIIRFKEGIKKYSKKEYLLGFLDKKYYKYLLEKNNKIINNLPFSLKKLKLLHINKWIKQKLH